MSDLFSGVYYYLSPSLSAEQIEACSSCLNLNGAVNAATLEAQNLTHVISDTDTFEGYQILENQPDVAVVTIQWFERSMALGKRQPTEIYSTKPADIFSGVVACVSGLSKADTEILTAGITTLGGAFRAGLTRDVTHLFTTSENSDKYETAMHFQQMHSMPIVLLPHWFDDALRIGFGQLPTLPYEWPDPRVLKGYSDDDPAWLERKQKSEANAKEKDKRARLNALSGMAYEDMPTDTKVKKDIWKSRGILLSRNLCLSGTRRVAVEAGILRAGGLIIEMSAQEEEFDEDEDPAMFDDSEELGLIEECDVYITRYRGGPDSAYAKALSLGKTIGALGWMFLVQSTGNMTQPQDQLLHFPIPQYPIPGFEGCEITVTNYTGPAREYLKKLIEAAGAKFTPSMSSRNTALIAATIGGSKTSKAISWSIPVVNHTWLEDCFSKWRFLTPALEKYILFPPGVDFARVLADGGTRGISLQHEKETMRLLSGGQGLEDDDNDNEEQIELKLPTQNSAKDAKEVEQIIDPDDDVDMDVAEPEVKTSPKKNKNKNREDDEPPKPKGKLTRAQQKKKAQESGEELEPPSKPSKNNTPKPKDSDSDGEDFSVRRRKALPPRRKVVPDEDTPMPDADEQPLITPKISPAKMKTYGGSNKRNKAKAMTPEDSEDDKKVNGRLRRLNKGKAKAAAEESVTEDEDVVANISKAPKKGKKGQNITDDSVSEDDDEEVSKPKPTPKSKAAAKTREEESEDSTAPKSKGKANGKKPSEQVKPSPKKAVKLAYPHNDNSEEEEVEAQLSAKSKAKGKAKAAANSDSDSDAPKLSANTGNKPTKLKRVVSVVIVGNSSNKASSSKAAVPKATARTESLRIQAGEISISKRTPTSKRALSNDSSDDGGPDNIPRPAASVSSLLTSATRSPSKRSASNKASQKLRDEIMPDVISYQNQARQDARARKSGDFSLTSYAGKRGNAKRGGEESDEGPKSKKRRLTEEEEDAESSAAEAEKSLIISSKVKGKKKAVDEDPVLSRKNPKQTLTARKSLATASSNIRIMTTQVKLSDDVLKALAKLGIKTTTVPRECTHLIASHLIRTEKFICALAVSPWIVSDKWAIACAKAKDIIPEKDYLLKDTAGEKKFKFKLADVLDRAKANGGNLLENKTFYITPKTEQKPLLKNVIVAHGGIVAPQASPSLRILDANEDRHVISCKEDKSIWISLASKYPIFSAELILQGAFVQEIDWDNESHRVDGSF